MPRNACRASCEEGALHRGSDNFIALYSLVGEWAGGGEEGTPGYHRGTQKEWFMSECRRRDVGRESKSLHEILPICAEEFEVCYL